MACSSRWRARGYSPRRYTYPWWQPVANPAMVMASTTANGSPSMSTRSLKVPGSDSSALHTRWCGRTGCPATASHFRPVGKAAPPRPCSRESLTSLITPAGPSSNARRSAWYPPWARYSARLAGSVRPTRRNRISSGSPCCGTDASAAGSPELLRSPPIAARTSTSEAGARTWVCGEVPASTTIAAGSPLAHTQAGRAVPRGRPSRVELALRTEHGCDCLRAGRQAGQIRADMHHPGRAQRR